MVYVWAYEQTHRKFDSQDVLIPWVRPEGQGLSRRNTVCCLNEQDDGESSTYFPQDNSLAAGQGSEPTRTKGGRVCGLAPSSHTPRRRSRSVGDDPESDSTEPPRESGRARTGTRLFGVFDKRSSSSLVSALSLPPSQRPTKKSPGVDSPGSLDKAQLAKLSSQLVTECRRLGRYLRSLSSKSFSSSCDDPTINDDVDKLECDAFIDETEQGTASLPTETSSILNGDLKDDESQKLSNAKTFKLERNDDTTRIYSNLDYKNGSNKTQNKQSAKFNCNVHMPSPTSQVEANKVRHLQNAIMFENINSLNFDPKTQNVDRFQSFNRDTCSEAKLTQKANLSLQIPVIRQSGVLNLDEATTDNAQELIRVLAPTQVIENVNVCPTNGYNDGYATDAECSPFGSRSPIGLCRTPEGVDATSTKCPVSCFITQNSTQSDITSSGRKLSRGSDNGDEEVSSESELKHLEKPKSYLQVVAPVLISSSADESDGMSPGNLSPCGWYTGGGATSGESDGPGRTPSKQRLNVIALDRVCFGQGRSNGREQLEKWVESQQNRNFGSSSEDLIVSPQYSGRPNRNKQSNSALRKHNLPHIQVHTLRDSDMKAYGSDPNLSDPPYSPAFLAAAEQDNARARAFSEVSAMDNAKSCRYSESVFSDTLRTPSIGTPCLRTPSSGGGPSDYNTSTEVLFAPSDLADRHDSFCDTDSVFTPDNERKKILKGNIAMREREPHFQSAKGCGNFRRNSENQMETRSQPCIGLKRQRKRKTSQSDKETQRLSSSDLDSLESPASSHASSVRPEMKEKSTQFGGPRKRTFNPVKAMFYKVAQIFSPIPYDDEDELLSDTDSQMEGVEAELPENEDCEKEKRSSNDTTTSTSVTTSLVSPLNSPVETCRESNRKESSSVCSRDDSSSETESYGDGKENCVILETSQTIGKDSVNITYQNHERDCQLKEVSCKKIAPKLTKHFGRTASNVVILKDNGGDDERRKQRESFINSLITKWYQLFGGMTSRELASDDAYLTTLLSATDSNTGTAENKRADFALNSSLTGAKRPETLDFSKKRSRLRNRRKVTVTVEKNTLNKSTAKQSSGKINKPSKPIADRRLSLGTAFNLLSEGASVDSFIHKLDDSALAVFAEMKKLNFAVREFPRSSITSDGRVSSGKKYHELKSFFSLEETGSTAFEYAENKKTVDSSVKQLVGNEAKDGLNEVQLVTNIDRQVKPCGPRRRFSDSTASQRGARSHGMIYLKPPNWNFGHSASQVVDKSGNLENTDQVSEYDSQNVQVIFNQSQQTEIQPKPTHSHCSSLCQTDAELEKDDKQHKAHLPLEKKHEAIGLLSKSPKCSSRSEEQLTNTEKDCVLNGAKGTNFQNQTQKIETRKPPDLPTQETEVNKNILVNKFMVNDQKLEYDGGIKSCNANTKEQSLGNVQHHSRHKLEPLTPPNSLEEFGAESPHYPLINLSKQNSEVNKLTDCNKPRCEDKSLSRYYHVFKQGELDGLIKEFVPALGLVDIFYDHSNWCVVAKKK